MGRVESDGSDGGVGWKEKSVDEVCIVGVRGVEEGGWSM